MRQIKLAAYEALKVVQEILPEGAKKLAFGLEDSSLGFVFIRPVQFIRVFYLEAAQLVGEGLAAQAQHLCGSRGIAALARERFGQKLLLDVIHNLFEVDGL